jgi:hypothetical protein
MPKFTINSEQSKQNCISAIMAIDVNSPADVEILPFKKTRATGQNSLMWAGMMNDFSTQGIIDGRKFPVPVWHEYLKELFLPEHFEAGITRKNYIKWLELPNGKLLLKGSTTQLTTLGFSQYMERCYHFGAEELEIRFSVSPNHIR